MIDQVVNSTDAVQTRSCDLVSLPLQISVDTLPVCSSFFREKPTELLLQSLRILDTPVEAPKQSVQDFLLFMLIPFLLGLTQLNKIWYIQEHESTKV